jgi:hypothetical protein
MAMKRTIIIGGEIMKRTIIFASLVMIAASVNIFGQTSDKKSDKNEKAKKEVIALVTEYNNAIVKKDAATMERILADDYSEISPTGFPTSKTLIVRFYKESPTDVPRPEAINFDDAWISVRVYENTAVLVGKIDLKWKESKEELAKKWGSIMPLPGDSYIETFVAVKKNGNWQIVSKHESIFELKFKISKD